MPPEAAAPPPIQFAHDSEAEIARLLDFYGIPWQYEPRSFPLEWDEQGRPTLSFTPDFYLPDYDLYLEITTIKPSLANRKNRKIRKLRECYPNVMIKLLAYKDIEALAMKYGRRNPPPEEQSETGQARKNLSDSERLADFAEDRSTPRATSSVPIDLSTRQDRTKHGDL